MKITNAALVIVPVLLSAAITARAASTFTGSQIGGKICFDGDGTVVVCGSPADTSSRTRSGPGGTSRMEVDPHDASDSWFCNLCHVNATSEVAGPRALRDAVVADAGLFWRRHDTIAARVVNKRVLTPVRDTKTLSPTLQKLMTARRAR